MTIFIAIVLLSYGIVFPLLLWVSAKIFRIEGMGLKRIFLIVLANFGLGLISLTISVLLLKMPVISVAVGLLLLCLMVWLFKRIAHTGFWRSLGCFLAWIILGTLATLGLRATVIEAFHVPTGGMDPTIMAGDRILTEKLSLRFRPPNRGEVVVYIPPNRREAKHVKRIVAIEGDKMELIDGVLRVNGIPSGDCSFASFEKPAIQFPTTVPRGKLFLLGDNRESSLDSRYVGYSDVRDVVAIPVLIYASVETKQDLLRNSDTQGGIRWDRIGKIVR